MNPVHRAVELLLFAGVVTAAIRRGRIWWRAQQRSAGAEAAIIRGDSTWAFLAFLFSSFTVLLIAVTGTSPALVGWKRALLHIANTGAAAYLFLLDPHVRNDVVKYYGILRKEKF